MVQVFDLTPTPSSASMLGQSLAQGIARNFPQPEQRVQQGLLQDAFAKLQQAPQGDFLTQLETIAPTLMTVPGGSELLGQIAPILSAKARSKAQMEAVQKRRAGVSTPTPGQPQTGEATPQERALTQGAQQEQELPESDEDTKIGQPYTKKELFPQGNEPTYPDPSAGPQLQRIMSPPELENYALDIMQSSDQMGQPMDYNSALQMANKQNENIQAYNNTVLKEMELRKENLKELNSDVVQRAINSNLIKSDDDEARTVAEKLGYEARKSNNPAQRWEHVRDGLRDFNTARQKIRREADLAGPFQSLWRKMKGTFKDKETVLKNLQPALQVYRKNGLYDEARAILSNELGFGPEDTETALFPFTKEQSRDINLLKNNSIKPKTTPTPFGETFPGEQFSLPEEKFQSFKEDLAGFLDKNKDMNLVSMRGVLNQNKKYSWQDISRAVNELIEEKRFTPKYQQSVQLGIINEAPLPGMGNIFEYWWKGAK